MGHLAWCGCLSTERRALFFIEQLESRQLLSAGVSLTPAQIASSHLVPVKWEGLHTYATPGQWVVVLDRPAGAAGPEIRLINRQLAGTQIHAVSRLNDSNIFLFRGANLPIDQVRTQLSALSGFVSVEPDTVRMVQTMPNDPNFLQQTGLNQSSDADIDAPEAWNLTTGSRGVVVAVLDTGVDYTHSDLAANIWTNPGEIAGNGKDDDGDGYIDDVHGYDFANNDGDPMDDNGHGTSVAGIIGAVGNNGVGVTGVNWQVQIMPLKFMSASGMGMTSAAVSALAYAAVQKTRGVNVRVINNSWGGGYSSSLELEIQLLNTDGILFTAAAGNSSNNNDTNATSPASLPEANIVSVAATDSSDVLAGDSNYGAASVDLAAPGVNIFTTGINNSYTWFSGTSAATPFVSGVAALAFAYDPAATVAQVKSALINGVDHLPSLAGKMVSGGRLNAFNTLNLLIPAPPGVGLNVNWFDSSDLTGTSIAGAVGPINYTWGTGSPGPAINPGTFSARWTGEVQAQYSETYTFYTLADDGVRVWINGNEIINRWNTLPDVTADLNGDATVNVLDLSTIASFYGQRGSAIQPYDIDGNGVIDVNDFNILAAHFGQSVTPVQDSAMFAMQAGQQYDIIVEYFQNTGIGSVKLSWSSPSTPKQMIPNSRLYPVGAVIGGGDPVPASVSTAPSLFNDKPITPTNDSVLS
ncbi:MAG TPA: S8 family serine peptidase [Tepidisphaeraceae bacterium]|jgi:subtilisin family serine protease|nr:S8 family serine peptidase [Tepidisphaeraceae bacterium]